MNVREQIAHNYSWLAKQAAIYSRLEEVAELLGIADADFYVDYGTYDTLNGKGIDGPYIKLEPRHVPGIALTSAGLSLVDTTPTLGDAAKILLPKVGKWEKTFDESNNKIILVARVNGVRIVLQDTPPETCTVEKIEEDVEVLEKTIPAHTEKKVRYVLKGDCDPLLTARTVQAESVGVELVEDVPL